MDTIEKVKPMPRIGYKAPEFKAITTEGDITFPKNYLGKWIILFSHPANWAHGDGIIVPTAGSCGIDKDRMETKIKGIPCHDWLFYNKLLSLDKVNHPKATKK